MAGMAYYNTLFTGQFYDGQICGRNRIYNLAKLAFFSVPLLRNEHKIEIRAILAVFWRISDGKSTFIGSVWLEWRTIKRYSPGSFMTGKFVGEIENTIWPNWHSFKFPY